ncbi:Rrf2 family transcriptional regulator [Halodesulfovibrio marinisediminis]|uniref:Transcriptional regulator n=1 Tax=Halodesulfovibrio marinisediminis DSM 17456 TaxID=1121457 RepID=A0A1N6FFQ6_9BACT|nr:Rrf2 family transcriptional regulator [Halodesulfovibrio marinisediminis]SIN94102.1 Transcriptional regulator [Halodesulfovibrio marinisediminis DSM 17456]
MQEHTITEPININVCVFLPDWILVRRDISIGAKLAFATLGTLVKAKDYTAMLNPKEIAKRMGTQEAFAKKFLRELKEAGWIGPENMPQPHLKRAAEESDAICNAEFMAQAIWASEPGVNVPAFN